MRIGSLRELQSLACIPFLGILASLQLIDPSVANIALVKASDALQMHGAVLALGASVSTLAQAASVLVMGFFGDRFGRRRVLAASLLLALFGNLLSMLSGEAGLFLLGRALTGIALGSVTGTGRHGRISVDDLRGAVIAAGGRFNVVSKASSASVPNGNKADDSQVPATPVARRLATELGINLLDCRRTGRHQRVSKADVEVAAHQHNTAMNGSATTASGVVEATPAPASPATSPQPLSAMRQIIAKRLQNSKREAPHFRACIEVEIDRLLALRKQLNNARNDANISVNDCLIKATAMALAAVPAVNIQFDGTQITPMPHADIAVAVALEDGLITPIVSRAETKGLVEISNEMRDLATRAKIGKLKPQEFQGGSFSISNLGMFGVSQFDAIINPPQAAILAVGVGERQLRPDGDSGVRQATVMTLTLSSDHRVIDGAIAAKFLQQLKSFIDQPATMLG